MSAYCDTCGAWRPIPHACFPVWEVRDTDCPGFQPEDPWYAASKIHAPDAESAAERFAEADDTQGDYLLSNGGEIVVEVRSADNRAKLWRLKCRAEHTTTYHSERMEDAEVGVIGELER